MADQKKDLVDEDVIAAGAVVNVMAYLKGIDFPANKSDVIRCARANGADPSAIEEIDHLPDGRTYKDPGELIAAIGNEVKGL